ncbi:MAG: hypothetical protein KC776_40130 [Myxococcales bacterium]|nr:hypothetical protein [Myxococcales bacterium]MCA9716188.1 hypothetical protein [Myxococcales bacterium]MCB9580644.1 hypothetical protein [Polyangiaceae bacterium]
MTRAFVVALLLTACGPPQVPPPYPAQRGEAPRSNAAIDGEVLGVDQTPPSAQLDRSVSLVIRPEADQPVEVHLAPQWYLDEHGMHIATGERVRIRGKGVTKAGKTVIEASRVEKGNQTLELRNASGKPLWQSDADLTGGR